MAHDSDTPSQQHPSGGTVTLDVLAERVKNTHDDIRRLSRKFDDFIDYSHSRDKEHIQAVEHCKAHDQYGVAIDQIRQLELPAMNKRIDGIMGAATNTPTADAADTPTTWLALAVHPRTIPIVCMLVMLACVVILVAALTGRDASTFVPRTHPTAEAP